MSPDSPEARIGRLEQLTARHAQRLDDLAHDVHELTPLVVSTTRMEGTIATLAKELGALTERVDKIAEALDTRDRAVTAERAATRRALLALTGVILAAVISGLATIVAVVVA